MKYYKALHDKVMIFSDRTNPLVFIHGELFTEKELLSYCKRNKWNFDKIVEHNFTPIEISKRDIYWSFGSRFA